MKTNRRQFLTASAGGVGAITLPVLAAAKPRSTPSTLSQPAGQQLVRAAIKELFASFTSEQRAVIVLKPSDERFKQVDANFDVTPPRIGGVFYSQLQRELVRRLLRASLSAEGHRRLTQQMRDDSGGLGGYYMAFFPLPAGVEWLLTGRHITLRASTVSGCLTPGPRVYGHGQWRPERSLYFHQTQAANRLYQSLSSKQRRDALLEDAPFEEDVAVPSKGANLSGLALGELSADRMPLLKQLVHSLTDLFEPEFARLVQERMLGARGRAASSLTFYREDDLREDGQWDLWRLQGPGYTWHFRGAPHVHAYLNVG